jgi:hypothetical protein
MPARHGRRKREALRITRHGFFVAPPPLIIHKYKRKYVFSDALHRKSRW